MKRELAKPFVKWVGGKRQLVPEIKKHIKLKSNTMYYEPFLGGGAVFLELQPSNAIVNDYNAELINAYNVIKNDVEALIEDLGKHKNDEIYFYNLREQDRYKDYHKVSNVERASRLIYLNKTCFNGMYRVNSQGYFNVPFGKYKSPNIVNEFVLRELNAYFNEADIKFMSGDYEKSLIGISKNSFVYFDPPYAPISTTSNFTGYTESGFDHKEQERLRNVCNDLNDQGVKFLLSNANVPSIQELYQDYNIEIVNAKRNINSIGTKRGLVEEVLIRNF
ncbi:DNA adenine methylase [Macrococcus brunensis]|uniref:DNA adenine methylase n=1 Tax=Macrococcus brunensis TaxID=198483 RepID=UPI001EF0BFE9|nr:DNA adenine methylase [Macrococcus brunensis]ULG74444.1 DNA adenine methylase [Macrococcus brunensis]